MARSSSAHRATSVVTLLAMLTLQLPAFAQTAATPQAWLFLRPHCESPAPLDPTAAVADIVSILKSSPDGCPNYQIRDPQSQQTPEIEVGNVLDMDVVLLNPSHAPISSVSVGLSYDPQVLEGLSVDLANSLPVPTPGEKNFTPAEGSAQFTATASPGGEPINGLLTIARIQFVINHHPRADITPIGFDDIQPGVLQGRTQVSALVAGEEKNIISPEIGALVVRTLESNEPEPQPSSEGSQENSSSQTSQESSESKEPEIDPNERTNFVLLQVQNVRAGTQAQAGIISVSWDPLESSSLKGYNLYYGTEKGRYIQRHSVTADSLSHVIRGLPVNTVYYLAVRGFNSQNEESAFSREVMIKTGDPRSSTSPLLIQIDPGPDGNPLDGSLTNVPGETGVSTLSLVAILFAAVIGTAFALRRQLRAASSR